MTRARTAVLALALGLLLSGCAGNAGAELRSATADLTAAANGRDADAVRSAVDDVLARLADAQAADEVTPQGAAVIRERALAVQAAADEIDPDVIARRDAEQQAEQEEQARIEAEREAAEEAERQRLEAERLAEEQEQARKAEEEAQKQAEEDAKKAEQERKKAEEEAAEDDDDDADASPTPSPTASPRPGPGPPSPAAAP